MATGRPRRIAFPPAKTYNPAVKQKERGRISLVIWNDFNEDSALMPMRWPAGSERYQYSRDESFLQQVLSGVVGIGSNPFR